MSAVNIVCLILIGFAAGIASGIFGIGGGIIIVPGLIYLLGFTPHQATGTSLAILAMPVGLLAVLEHYQKSNVKIPAAVMIAASFFIAAKLGAKLAHKVTGPQLRVAFGAFVIVVGISIVIDAIKGWSAN